MEYQEEQVAEGLKATMYVVGDKATDGHTHIFYLRDDLPLATTTASDDLGHHAHSIERGPGQTVQIHQGAHDHTHTKLAVAEKGDYNLRGLHTP